MKMRYLALVALLLHTATGNAQWSHYHHYRQPTTEGQKRFEKRTYVGLLYPKANVNLLTQYEEPTSGTIYSSTTNPSSPGLGLKKAFGLVGGSFAKLVSIDENNEIALDMSITAEIFTYNIGFPSIDTNSYKVTYTYTGQNAFENLGCVAMRMPIAVVYKTGPEVSLNANGKMMFSAGAGLAPSLVMSSYANENVNAARIAPFLMAELGISCVKVRASYFFGNNMLVQATSDDFDNYNAPGPMLVTANSTGFFELSLLFLPYVGQWENNSY
jgi:hypothetical protein